MTEGAGTDPTKLSANTKRKVALHKAYVKRAGMDTPKNTSLLQTNPDAAVKAPTAKVVKLRGKPAKGPAVSDAGLMNSSSSGSAMGPAYMR